MRDIFKALLPLQVSGKSYKVTLSLANDGKALKVEFNGSSVAVHISEQLVKRVISYGLRQLIADTFAGRKSVTAQDIAQRLTGERAKKEGKMTRLKTLKEQLLNGEISQEEFIKQVQELL